MDKDHLGKHYIEILLKKNNEILFQPAGISFDSIGNFMCADSKAQRILTFSADGEYKGDVSSKNKF